MLNKIFGNKKDELMDMMVYWNMDVTVDDMLYDLSVLGELVNRPHAQKVGCRISTVKEEWINDTRYAMCELVITKELNEAIEKGIQNKLFKAVVFSATII